MRKLMLSLGVHICLLGNLLAELPITYPPTEQIPFIQEIHGKKIDDPYQWLEDGQNPNVIAWTHAQNEMSREYLNQLPQKKALVKRLDELSRHDDQAFKEVLIGKRRFISTKKAEDDRWVLNYQDPDGPLIELLNPNHWKNETLEFASPSRDGKYIAFAKAQGGNEKPVIQIMKVDTKTILPDTLRGTKQGWPNQSVSWAKENKGFYYSANPGPDEPLEKEYWNAVYYHALGTQAKEDQKLYYDKDNKEQFHSVRVSEEGKHLLLSKWRMRVASELYLVDISGDNKSPQPMATGFDASYEAIFAGNKLIILSNKDAPNYQLFITDIDHPGKEHWKLLIPEQKDRIVDVDAVGGNLYVNYLHNASTQIKVYSLEGKYLHDVPLPAIGTANVSGYFSKPEVWLSFSSFAYPKEFFSFQPQEKKLSLVYKADIPFDPTQFVTEQVWYPSKDGTKISMFIIKAKNHAKGPIPFMLTGYGGFDVAITPTFSDGVVALLESGVGIAIPNLRGGGEYGQSWHRSGCLENKQNVFDDFIAAAEWLQSNGYTTKKQLAIRGGSNGGLLVGAVLTQRPDLFQVAISEVPLLDMLRYHLFGFANIWKDEYGSPEEPEQFCYLMKYSPYHNIKSNVTYPATLITAGENDGRVDPLHAKKMTAKLQEVNPNGPLHLLLVENESGHGGGTTLTAKIEQRALRLAFLLSQVGL